MHIVFQKIQKPDFIVFLFLLLSFNSCSDTSKKQVQIIPKEVHIKQSFIDKVTQKNEDSYLFLEVSCLYCHQMTVKKDKAIAPTMEEVRNTYKKLNPTKETFVKAIVLYKMQPTKGTSLMKGAIEEYGVMPDTGMTSEDVEEIATFLYNYNFKK